MTSSEVLLEVLPGPRRRFYRGHAIYIPCVGQVHEALAEAGGRFRGGLWSVDAGTVDELTILAELEGLEVRVL